MPGKVKIRRKKLNFYAGNFLMILASLMLLYIYYPLISLYLNPPKVQGNLPKSGFFITIPQISAQAPIIENVDPWKKTEYLKALENGVAEASGSAELGGDGTIFLFAHSSDDPWRITKYNTVFLKLGDLKIGDLVKLTKDGKDYQYKVRESKVVLPTEISYLKNLKEGHQLILQTCTPIGTAFKRLLVFADPV